MQGYYSSYIDTERPALNFDPRINHNFSLSAKFLQEYPEMPQMCTLLSDTSSEKKKKKKSKSMKLFTVSLIAYS